LGTQQISTVKRLDQSDITRIESRRSSIIQRQIRRFGGGYGDPTQNAETERRAIAIVTRDFEARNFTVESVERKYCGYDLLCRSGRIEEHVEVKGVAGDIASFIITAGEVREANANPRFMLYVVTSALSKQPTILRLSGSQFVKSYRLSPTQFRAVPGS
jgi:hypothetical protein